MRSSPTLSVSESHGARALPRLGVTLLELLCAIAIICLLIGLLVPAVWYVKSHTRRVRAKNEVMELKSAWLAYQLNVGPLPAGVTMMNSNALDVLRSANIRNMQHLDSREGAPYYCDPWGVPGTTVGVYRVAFDEDADNRVRVGAADIPATVAVWSAGPDRADFTGDDVVSWE